VPMFDAVFSRAAELIAEAQETESSQETDWSQETRS
jgi:hypothetical protein